MLCTSPALAIEAPPPRTDPVRNSEWHLRYLKADQAQRHATGAGVTVAVPDTGIALHPDLRKNLLPGLDTTNNKAGDGRRDLDGHGTGMAGLIAAHGGPGNTGILGIAPEAKLLPIRGKERSEGGNTEDLAAGIDFAIEHGADVISISAAAGADIRLQQAIRAAIQANIVVVAAAGNTTESSIVEYPASSPDVIAVGGIDRNGNRAAISVSGPEIDVVAPAVDIYSTGINGGYRVGTGTSDATAIVAGAAALIRSKYPDLPAQEVAHRLTATAIDKGPPGRDDEYGYGVIDLVAALTADVPPLGFESPSVTAPTSTAAHNNSDDNSTARGLATLGVLLAAGGGYLVWRRRRRAGDPPPRISR
ncbi:type VII secretion-associated serine protease mycosin [Micromonospora sp. A3M-1-15]|uniref:type VII secretion-associated serine protease mycosin n=1 Tax=Micromonospora sp. A3M-1-15 TaxID=2962035 RepID=UPI00211457E5|nr:type VII secretion-associated serine protease mycosin [Micromonospora sp. A3M-1-15]